MKILKIVMSLLAVMLAGQGVRAQQCVSFYPYQPAEAPNVTYFFTSVTAGITDSAQATFEWDYGDGVTETTTGYGIHSYTAPGTYNVCLTYTSPQCTSTFCNAYTKQACAFDPLSVTQTVNGNNISFSVANAPANAAYNWYFPNGQPGNSSLSNPSVTFPTNIVDNGWVSISYGSNCVRHMPFTVNTLNYCNPGWNYSAYGKGISVSSYNSYASSTYEWDFGDDITVNGANATHEFLTYGTYNVCLNVTGPNCTESLCKTISLTPPSCNIGDSLYAAYQQDYAQYYFYTNALHGYRPGLIVFMDYGDGSPIDTLEDANGVLHSYTATGTYSVCATYVDDYCSETRCFDLLVDMCPQSSILANPSGNTDVSFTLANMQPIWNYSWAFSNGYTSTNDSVVVNFATGGTYAATATITTSACSTPLVLTTSVTIPENGYCDFNMQCNASDYSVHVNFVNLPQLPITSMIFDYEDGDTISYINTHTYTSVGVYNVCATVVTDYCSVTKCQEVTISAPIQNIYIEGQVYKDSASVCGGIVYLIGEISDSLYVINSKVFVDTGGLCNSQFHFNVPSGGVYKLKAVLNSSDPDYANYLPTYYGNVLNWTDGTAITTFMQGADINLTPGTNPGGPGFIGGLVSEGAGLGMIHDYQNRDLGDPVPNVQINLLTENDVPVAYTFTNGGGMYSFSHIAYGTYKVYAEVIGKTPYPQLITINANNPSANNVNVDINSHSAVTGINDIAELKLDAVYPNPVKEVATISFTAKQSTEAQVVVTDARGVVIHTSTTDINAGGNELKIKLANQAAGVYVVSITNNDNKKIVKLLKAE